MIMTPKILLSLLFSTALAASRKKFLGANWKCSLEDTTEVDRLVDHLNHMWKSLNASEAASIELCVHPPYIFLDRVRQRLHRSISVGSQNVLEAVVVASKSSSSTTTGTCTPHMLRAIGCEYVLLGHSDRRNQLGETNEMIADKVRESLECGMNVILTIGETKFQRNTGRALSILRKQLEMAAKSVPINAWHRIVVAYEPVWAIGAGGKPCSPQETLRILTTLRTWIQRNVNEEAASACRFTYTGSVNEKNADIYARLVDGFVVGRAGLDTIKLKSIIKTLANSH